MSQSEMGGNLAGGLPVFVLGGLRIKSQLKREKRKVEAQIREQGVQLDERGAAITQAATRGQEAVLRQSVRLIAGIAAIAVLVTLLPRKRTNRGIVA